MPDARKQARKIKITNDELITRWRARIYKRKTIFPAPLCDSHPKPRILASISAGGSSNVTSTPFSHEP